MIDFKINEVERNKIIQMLTEEQKVRYSKEIQTIYTEQFYASKDPNYKPIRIESEIQKYILNKFGYNSDENSLKEYWKIPSTYWNDEEVKNSIFYMKLNIFKYPKVYVEDEMIDAKLINYKTGENVLLSQLQNPNKHLVILAGSMT